MSKHGSFAERIFIRFTVLVLCCFFSFTMQAGAVSFDTTVSPSTPWNGFGPDFEPEWEGETTTVTAWPCGTSRADYSYVWSGPWESCDSTLLIGSWPVTSGHWETRPTVRKVTSSSNSKVTNFTLIRIGEEEFTAEKNDSNGSSMACYAELISPSKEVLANASSIAYKTSDFNGTDFSASGRVSSFALLSTATLLNDDDVSGSVEQSEPAAAELPAAPVTIPKRNFTPPVGLDLKTQGCKRPENHAPALSVAGLLSPQMSISTPVIFPSDILLSGNEISLFTHSPTLTGELEKAEAQACGKSWFNGTYELDQATDFSLELDVAQWGDVAISFTATDLATNEITSLLPLLEPGSSQTINVDGTFEAGTYEFQLFCESTASLDDTGSCDPGGEAKFDLSFDLEEEYVEVWVDNDWSMIDFNSDDIYTIESLESLESVYSFLEGTTLNCTSLPMSGAVGAVPEPSTLIMLIFGGLVVLPIFWRRYR